MGIKLKKGEQYGKESKKQKRKNNFGVHRMQKS